MRQVYLLGCDGSIEPEVFATIEEARTWIASSTLSNTIPRFDANGYLEVDGCQWEIIVATVSDPTGAAPGSPILGGHEMIKFRTMRHLINNVETVGKMVPKTGNPAAIREYFLTATDSELVRLGLAVFELQATVANLEKDLSVGVAADPGDIIREITNAEADLL
jgi:hypothetical protein